jgi:Na+/melibiose symporter-like transporter
MIEDTELHNWREQWRGTAAPPAEFLRKVQQRIKRQDRRFVLGNVFTIIAFIGLLIFALYMRRESASLGTGWATGICILVFVVAGVRVWVLRQTWRPQTQTTRAFVELWHKRVAARIRLLQISIYLSLGWLAFCAVAITENWATIGRDVRANPQQWIALIIVCVLMQPVLWYWASLLRRRKLAELREVAQILHELDERTAS